MYIKNATYKTVPTGSLSFPLAEGAVVTAGGVTGIVPENVAAAGPTAQIYVAVGGTIDLTSEANKGVSFTDAQIKALGSDFNFVPASEKEIPTPTLADAGKVVAVNETGTEYELVEPGSGLPEYTSADEGKVLSVSSGGTGLEWASKAYILELLQNNTIIYVNETMAEILSIISSGTPLILHIPSSSEYIPSVGYFTIPFVGEVPDEEIYIVNCGEFVLAATTLNDSPSYNFD